MQELSSWFGLIALISSFVQATDLFLEMRACDPAQGFDNQAEQDQQVLLSWSLLTVDGLACPIWLTKGITPTALASRPVWGKWRKGPVESSRSPCQELFL